MTRKESERRYFLVQSTGNRAHHWTRRFEDRTYAEELQRHHYYRHDAWQTGKKDQDFGQVRAGDRASVRDIGRKSNPSAAQTLRCRGIWDFVG